MQLEGRRENVCFVTKRRLRASERCLLKPQPLVEQQVVVPGIALACPELKES
jgi:hypothetical protein